MRDLMTIAEGARSAKHAVARLGANGKNRALEAIASALEAHTEAILGPDVHQLLKNLADAVGIQQADVFE